MSGKSSWLCLVVVLSTGCAGPKGDDGADGRAGADGASALVTLTPEPAGAHCASGGTRIDTGLDTDRDGALAASEVTQTHYLCTTAAPHAALVNVRAEPAGASCVVGGAAIETGVDVDDSGVLEAGEVTQTRYVCNGLAGTSASTALVKVTRGAAPPCPATGVLIESGLDTNANGTLDVGEVLSTTRVCDGTSGSAGATTLTNLSTEPNGTNCAAGGLRVQVGADLDGDGQLEQGEVTATRFVCNGQAGTNGATGATGPTGTVSLVLVDAEAPGATCTAGGRRVRSGLDTDGDGVLDPGEVLQTAYVCHGVTGAAGRESLISQVSEPAGATCPFGGVLLRSGLDLDADGVLDPGEVTATNALCNAPQYFATGWATSFLKQLDSGEVPPGTWQSVRRQVTLFKQRSDTYLKLTVTDNARFGFGATGATSGTYAVLMNGAWINCATSMKSRNGSDAPNDIHAPLAMVCVVPGLPAGLYEFESFVESDRGTAYVGWNTTDAQTLVEELLDPRFAYTATSDEVVTTSASPAPATGRSLSYVKQSATTVLKLTVSDTLRATTTTGDARVVVRMDGADTTCALSTADAQGGEANEYHAPFVMTCVLAGVPAGTHAFSVWFSANGGGVASLGGATEHSLVLVEERDATNLSFTGAASSTADLVNTTFAPVPGRALTVFVPTAGRYKLTYSDTFRAAGGSCNGQAGYYGVWLDGVSAERDNALRFGGSNAVQDHPRGINHTSVWWLQPGSHTFAIHARTDCGANVFGWQRGQVLMLLEPM